MRSRPKLFNGLAFAVAGFTLFYTILTILVLEPHISWQWLPWGRIVSLSRGWLIAVPLISMGCSGILLRLGRTRPDLWAVENFLFSLLLFFLQLDKLNLAKGIDTSPVLELTLTLAAMAAYAIHSLRKK